MLAFIVAWAGGLGSTSPGNIEHGFHVYIVSDRYSLPQQRQSVVPLAVSLKEHYF
jgi:hypothetical protein